MYRHILIATDGSELAEKAVEQGLELAQAVGARVTGLTVREPFYVHGALGGLNPPSADVLEGIDDTKRRSEEHATAILGAAAKHAAALGVDFTPLSVEHDDAHTAIIENARGEGADLIVLASHGRGGIAALVLGSVTLKVLTHSTIPVLVLR